MTVGDRRLDGRGLILIRAMKFVESSTNILTVRLVCVVGGFMVLGLVGALPTPDFVWALVGDLCPSGFKKVGPVPGEGFFGGEVFLWQNDLLPPARKEEFFEFPVSSFAEPTADRREEGFDFWGEGLCKPLVFFGYGVRAYKALLHRR